MDSAFAELLFPHAASRWIEWKRPYHALSSLESYGTWIIALSRFFGGLRLKEIKPGHLVEYQRMRSTNADSIWKRPATSGVVNHELNTLCQVLEYAGLWQRLKPYYRPLPTPRWSPPRGMTTVEEWHLFETAASDAEYELAYLVASITNNTTASGKELRCMQIMHVDLLGSIPSVTIPLGKNDFRGRRIPLNDTAAKQFERCLKRAARLGSVNQDHHLFPFRVKRNTYDPSRPASRSWVRNSFNKLRTAAGLPWLKPHDLRHQAVTRLLESGAPEHTVMSVAGHVSRKMVEHYSHTRLDAKMAAVRAIEPRHFTHVKPKAAA